MIYLDNSATTKPSQAAVNAVIKASTELFANPSSIHSAGAQAAQLLLEARNEILVALHGQQIRQRLPRKPGMLGGNEFGRLIFTSSGTESDNLAIRGIISSTKIKNPEIITTDSEHPAVLETARKLEAEGKIKLHLLKTVNGVIKIFA